MTSHSVKSPTISLSSPLAALNHISQCCKLIKCVPPGTAPPESLPATAVTVLYVMSIVTNSSGRSSYESRLAAVAAQASGCLALIISITWFPVVVHHSPGCMTPTFSHSAIHLTNVRIFPQSTRLWYVCSQFSAKSSLWSTVRYSAHVRRVSSTSTPFLPSSQASRRFSIRGHMEWYAVTCLPSMILFSETP